MLKSITLALALLVATQAQANQSDAYLLIAISDMDDDYVMDADLSHSDCLRELKDFDFNKSLGIYSYDTLVQVKLVDAFCVTDDGGDF